MLGGLDDYLGLVGLLVLRVDASKVLDETGSSFLVETLDVTLFAHLERRLHVDLDEIQVGFLVNLAHTLTIDGVRADERAQADYAGVGEELGNLADTTNVLGAFFAREAQVRVEAVTNVVAVKRIGDTVTLASQVLFESERERGLARARQSSEPNGATILTTGFRETL